jgi:uncharacterized protein YecT (DUF1311 family)
MDCSKQRYIDAQPGGASQRPKHHPRPLACPLGMAAALIMLVLISVSAALPAQESVPKPLPPTGEELLKFEHKSLRSAYSSCMDAATGSMDKQEACVDEEFAYHDDELNRIYREQLATLSARDQNVLRDIERRWIRQTYGERGCKMPANPTPAQRLDTKQCLTAATIVRWRQLQDPRFVARRIEDWLNPRRDDRPDEGRTRALGAYGLPDDAGGIVLRIGNLRIRSQVSDCKGESRIQCRVEALTLTSDVGQQALEPTQLVFMGTTGRTGFDVVTQDDGLSDIPASSPPTFSLYDINDDGQEDLILWTGFMGNYGAPSYAFYLFDSDARRFVENHALAETTKGFRVVRIHHDEIELQYTRGACVHGSRILVVRGSRPIEVSRHEYNTCD